jgi:hypothetical protein
MLAVNAGLPLVSLVAVVALGLAQFLAEKLYGIERVPERGNHNFLRAGFCDICASHVSVSSKSDRSRSLSDCRRIILSDENLVSGHGWRALGRRSLQFPDRSFGCKVGSDSDALSPGVTMLGTVRPGAPLLSKMFGEMTARQCPGLYSVT